MNQRDDILRKVQGLLALANKGNTTEGEIHAALGRARHLCQQHGLTDAEVNAFVGEDGQASVRFTKKDVFEMHIHVASKMQRWDWLLANAVALATDTGYYIGQQRDESSSGWFETIQVYGLETDCRVAEAIYKWVRGHLSRLTRTYCKEQRAAGRPAQGNNVIGRSFKDGFCKGLLEVAEEMKDEPVEETDSVQVQLTDEGGTASTALVPISALVVAKREVVDLYRGDLGLTTGRKSSVKSSGDDRAAGHARGVTTSLNRNHIT